MSKSLEALKKISNIDLYHEEIIEDEDLDGEWIVERDCVYDGIVSEIYKEELDAIKQDLEAYEQLKQDHDKTLINNGKLVVKVEDLKEDLRLTTIERTNCEDIWEEEYQKCCQLEKALDKACEMIAICPPNVNIEECEKVENECKDCWKRYLLKEVL